MTVGGKAKFSADQRRILDEVCEDLGLTGKQAAARFQELTGQSVSWTYINALRAKRGVTRPRGKPAISWTEQALQLLHDESRSGFRRNKEIAARLEADLGFEISEYAVGKKRRDLGLQRNNSNAKDMLGFETPTIVVVGRGPDYVRPDGSNLLRWRYVCKHCGGAGVTTGDNLRRRPRMACPKCQHERGGRQRRILSDEDCVEIVAHYGSGASLEWVASHYGVSVTAITGVLDRKGVARRDGVIDRVGETFGSLKVLARQGHVVTANSRRVAWLCRCRCGNDCVVAGDKLATGQTTSCGCGRSRNAKLSLFDDQQSIKAAELYESGSTLQEVASYFGVSTSPVITSLRRLGIQRRDGSVLSDMEMDEIALAYQAGRSVRSLSKDYGVDASTVYRALDLRGMSLRPYRVSDNIRDGVVKLADEGASIAEAADLSGLDKSTVRSILDPVYKVISQYRSRIRSLCLVGVGTSAALGYGASELSAHLWLQLPPEWSLHDHGKVWHIDHVVPLTAWPDPCCQEAWSLSNLCVIASEENLAKGSRFLGVRWRHSLRPKLPLDALIAWRDHLGIEDADLPNAIWRFTKSFMEHAHGVNESRFRSSLR